MALTQSANIAQLPRPVREAPVRHPDYSFQGNDSETVLDVYLPGVRRSDISLQLTGHDLLVVGKCFPPGKRGLLQPSLLYVLRVQLASPVDRKAVNAVMRGVDTLRVRIPAASK